MAATPPPIDPAAERRKLASDRRNGTPRGGRRRFDVIGYIAFNRNGQPLSTDQLARAIGVSTHTIRADIRAGALKAFKAGGQANKRREYRVLFLEAKRYLIQMGVIDPSVTPPLPQLLPPTPQPKLPRPRR